VQSVTALGRPCTASCAQSALLPPSVRTAPLALSLQNTPLPECAQRPRLSLPPKCSTTGGRAKPPSLSFRNTLPPACTQCPQLSPSETVPCQRARNAPGSPSLRNALLPVGEQSPLVSPFETLCPRRARNAPSFLPPKQSPANVRAMPLAFLRPEHSATNVGACGGGGWGGGRGTQPEVVDSSINLNDQGTGRGTNGGRRTKRSETNVGGNRSLLKAVIP